MPYRKEYPFAQLRAIILVADPDAEFGKYRGSGGRVRLGVNFDQNSSVADVLLNTIAYRVNKDEHNFCTISVNRLKWEQGEWDSLSKIVPRSKQIAISSASAQSMLCAARFSSMYGSNIVNRLQLYSYKAHDAMRKMIELGLYKPVYNPQQISFDESHTVDALILNTLAKKETLLSQITLEGNNSKDNKHENRNGMEGLLSKEGLSRYIRCLELGTAESIRGRPTYSSGDFVRSEEPSSEINSNIPWIHVQRETFKEFKPLFNNLPADVLTRTVRELGEERKNFW